MLRIVFVILVNTVFSVNTFAEVTSYKDIRAAIQNGNIELFESLVKAGFDFSAAQENEAVSILEMGAYFNKVDIIKALIKSHPDLLLLNGADALHLACATNRRYKEVMEFLVDSGVNINQKNKKGENCLLGAAVAVDPDFFNYLINIGADPKAKVSPHSWLNIKSPVTVEAFVSIRLRRHEEMLKHITSKTSGAVTAPLL